MNSVSLIGNLGQAPEMHYTEGGVAIANLNIAVNEFYTAKSGEKVKKTHWFRAVAFQRTAEIVEKYCTKGSKIGIQGQLQQRTWQNDDGANRSAVEIRVNSLVLLDAKNGNSPEAEEDAAAARENNPGGSNTGDDDIPF